MQLCSYWQLLCKRSGIICSIKDWNKIISFHATFFFFFFFNPVTAMHPPVSGLGSQCISGNGEDYRGRIAITESGNTCQHWNTQFPHKHGWIPGRYPCKYAEPPHFSKYPRTWFSLSDPDKKTGGAVTLISYFLSFCHLSLLLFRPCSSFFFLHSSFSPFFF